MSEEARDDLMDRLKALGDDDFKRVFKALFEQVGWNVVWREAEDPSGDLLFFAERIPFAMSRPGIVGRVRRRPGAGTAAEIQEVASTIADWDDDMVAFVAMDGFDEGAVAMSEASGRRILLTGGDELVGMWVEKYESVEGAARELLPVGAADR